MMPALPDQDPEAEIQRLAQDLRRANGPVMGLVNRLGGRLEDQISLLPERYRGQLERAVSLALSAGYGAARQGERLGASLPGRIGKAGPGGRMAAAVTAGALGGAGGLATALAELPLTVTLFLGAIRDEARRAGLDPDDPAIRAECLRVFGAGSPLAEDDGVNTSFLSARLTVTGPALQKIIATVAPRFAAALGQKLAAQAVPLLGALSGGALNAAFLSYYREVARLRFALLTLSARHGPQVMTRFSEIASPPRLHKA